MSDVRELELEIDAIELKATEIQRRHFPRRQAELHRQQVGQFLEDAEAERAEAEQVAAETPRQAQLDREEAARILQHSRHQVDQLFEEARAQRTEAERTAAEMSVKVQAPADQRPNRLVATPSRSLSTFVSRPRSSSRRLSSTSRMWPVAYRRPASTLTKCSRRSHPGGQVSTTCSRHILQASVVVPRTSFAR